MEPKPVLAFVLGMFPILQALRQRWVGQTTDYRVSHLFGARKSLLSKAALPIRAPHRKEEIQGTKKVNIESKR